MPKPTRRKSTLRKIAERGLGFSGTTKEHKSILCFEDPVRYVADKHYFYINKTILEELLQRGGNKEIMKKAKESISNALGYALHFAKIKIKIVNGRLQISFEDNPIILYSFDSYSNKMSNIPSDMFSSKNLPHKESLHSQRPFHYFEITLEMINFAFEVWKKRYPKAINDLEPTSSFLHFLIAFLYKRFLIHIIEEYKKQIIKKKSVQKK